MYLYEYLLKYTEYDKLSKLSIYFQLLIDALKVDLIFFRTLFLKRCKLYTYKCDAYNL